MEPKPIKFLDLEAVNRRYQASIQKCLSEVASSGWYLKGEKTEEFEKNYARYIGSDYCVGCGNGLDAITLILMGYKELGVLKDGDEVILPGNTFIATFLAVSRAGLTPCAVDPDSTTLRIDPERIEAAITDKTKALILVHLYGRCAYSEEIEEICRRNQLKLIEDNAQAHGCLWNGRRTGSLGDAAAHSFYPGKNLGALGDAGAVTTNDRKLADVVRALGNYGSERKYIFPYKGLNSRIDELQAAVLNEKLKGLDEDNEKRKELAKIYLEGIKNPMVKMPECRDFDADVFHIFPIFTRHRDSLQRYLAENGVETLIHYPVAPHKQECYRGEMEKALPETELLQDEELSLPISPALSEAEVRRVVELINEWQP